MEVGPTFHLNLHPCKPNIYSLFDYSSCQNTTTMDSTVSHNVIDDIIDQVLVAIMINLVQEEQEVVKPRQSRKISKEEGHRKLELLLNCGYNDRIKAALRMSKDTFYSLRNWLLTNTNLKASKHISVEMKLAIFLYITTRPASQRDTIEYYGVGNRVISE